jgi:hypothetical protein
VQVITGGEDAVPPVAGPEGDALSIEDQDAPKRTWDVYDPTTDEVVTSLAGLKLALAPAGLSDQEWRVRVLEIYTSPAIEAAPQRLRDEMAAFLAAVE